jgi:hypothetical protein
LLNGKNSFSASEIFQQKIYINVKNSSFKNIILKYILQYNLF